MEDVQHAVHGQLPPITERDRFIFNICRTCVGTVVLTLTFLGAVLCAQVLVVEGTSPTPPPMPPSQPWTLFSEEDAHATRMILLISGGQACLIAAIAVCCWLRRRRKTIEGSSETASGDGSAALLRRKRRAARGSKRSPKNLPSTTGMDVAAAGAYTMGTPVALGEPVAMGQAVEHAGTTQGLQAVDTVDGLGPSGNGEPQVAGNEPVLATGDAEQS